MLRITRLACAARCHYKSLGVAATATKAEIASAFREKAKRTHPDTAGGAPSSAQTQAFDEIVEAYRVLGDSKKRLEYDSETNRRVDQQQWPYGEAQNMSEEFRQNLYGKYGPPGAGGDHYGGGPGRAPPGGWQQQGGPSPRGGMRAGDEAMTGPDYTKGAATMVAFFGLAFLVTAVQQPAPGSLVEKGANEYPTRLPGSKPGGGGRLEAAAGSKASTAQIEAQVTTAMSTGTLATTSSAAASSADPAPDEMVRAYFNPYMNTWHRIPDGYDAPSPMDLTAWTKKRTDGAEWGRLISIGKMSEIQPRGSLQVRYVPRWNTMEPVLVRDPQTSKTIKVTTKLQSRTATPDCGVQF